MYDLVPPQKNVRFGTFTLVSLWIYSTSTVSYNSTHSKDNNNTTYYLVKKIK